MSNQYQFFRVTQPQPFVAHVEVHRPERINSFSRPVWLEFGRVFRDLSHDANVRAVVLSGSGEKGFTAGLDVKELQGDLFPSSSSGTDGANVAQRGRQLRDLLDEFQACISEAEKCAKPVIVVLHGICFGLAVDIASCADIRICTRDVRIAVKEVDIGIAADVGTLARLPKIVGNASWVRDVCLTGRDVGADEAVRLGLVSTDGTGTVAATKAEAIAQAVAMAKTIAEKSPVAVQGIKNVLLHARDHTVQDNLDYVRVWNGLALQAPDFQDSLRTPLRGKRPPYAKL